jgi:hypothetical protein
MFHLVGGLEILNFMTFQKQLGIESSSQLTFTPSLFSGAGGSTTSQIIINHIITI